jgi:protein-S-isoprenylcysteine O-methyltransferase Ste14
MNISFNIFTSHYAAAGFIITLVAFFVAEQIGGVIVPGIKRGGARVQRKSFGSGGLVILCWVAVLAATVITAKLGNGLLSDWVYFAGIAVMVGGIFLRQWSIAVLGRYFSGTLGVQSGQKVVDRGPYHYIRHPSYTGVLVFFVGMGLAVQSWVAALLGAAFFAIGYGYRIHVEEKVLISELGESYTDYMKRTKRVIPKIV